MKKFTLFMSPFLCVALAGCQVPVSGTVLPARQTMTAVALTGTYKGTYNCFQGITGGSLSLIGHPDGTVEGTFSFYPVPQNRQVLSGKYKIFGKYYPDMGLILKPTEWIERPANYIPVSFDGRAVVTKYKGTIPECNNMPFDFTFVSHTP